MDVRGKPGQARSVGSADAEASAERSEGTMEARRVETQACPGARFTTARPGLPGDAQSHSGGPQLQMLDGTANVDQDKPSLANMLVGSVADPGTHGTLQIRLHPEQDLPLLLQGQPVMQAKGEELASGLLRVVRQVP